MIICLSSTLHLCTGSFFQRVALCAGHIEVKVMLQSTFTVMAVLDPARLVLALGDGHAPSRALFLSSVLESAPWVVLLFTWVSVTWRMGQCIAGIQGASPSASLAHRCLATLLPAPSRAVHIHACTEWQASVAPYTPKQLAHTSTKHAFALADSDRSGLLASKACVPKIGARSRVWCAPRLKLLASLA